MYVQWRTHEFTASLSLTKKKIWLLFSFRESFEDFTRFIQQSLKGTDHKYSLFGTWFSALHSLIEIVVYMSIVPVLSPPCALFWTQVPLDAKVREPNTNFESLKRFAVMSRRGNTFCLTTVDCHIGKSYCHHWHNCRKMNSNPKLLKKINHVLNQLK